ncbi:MAG: hypothetical protein Q8L29_00830 [archaeon]|nr:hypothetical protein [archaeon]
MINIQTKLRRMGNSLGIIVPSEVVNHNKFREGDELIVEIQFKRKTSVEDMLREARKRNLKFKRTTEEILKEINEDSD